MKLEQIPGDYDKVAPWDMEYDGKLETI